MYKYLHNVMNGVVAVNELGDSGLVATVAAWQATLKRLVCIINILFMSIFL